MTTTEEFITQWDAKTPEERRARLNELGARYGELGEDEVREHDVLAVVVATDEETAAQAEKNEIDGE